MTNDPVIHALLDLCEQAELATGTSSQRLIGLERACAKARDVIRARVAPATPYVEGSRVLRDSG